MGNNLKVLQDNRGSDYKKCAGCGETFAMTYNGQHNCPDCQSQNKHLVRQNKYVAISRIREKIHKEVKAIHLLQERIERYANLMLIVSPAYEPESAFEDELKSVGIQIRRKEVVTNGA